MRYKKGNALKCSRITAKGPFFYYGKIYKIIKIEYDKYLLTNDMNDEEYFLSKQAIIDHFNLIKGYNTPLGKVLYK